MSSICVFFPHFAQKTDIYWPTNTFWWNPDIYSQIELLLEQRKPWRLLSQWDNSDAQWTKTKQDDAQKWLFCKIILQSVKFLCRILTTEPWERQISIRCQGQQPARCPVPAGWLPHRLSPKSAWQEKKKERNRKLDYKHTALCQMYLCS